ncbi:MAG TPA: sigma 54-interacting transcriptional regulator [Polyangiaceae bacterium]|nr:sigma 54-interacting transcriptional regulator [Polyangiaceae bacterium]
MLRNDTTAEEEIEQRDRRAPPTPNVMALVVVWCAQEPTRLGEVVVVPPGASSEPRVLGRGPADGSDQRPRLDFARHAPGKVKLSTPLSIHSVSRSQLLIRAIGDETLEVKNVGRAELDYNGTSRSLCHVEPGSTLQIGRQLLLLCVRRPAWLPADPTLKDHHSFGGADADGLVGESAPLWELRRTLAFVASRPDHVLIHGPTGTGKELVARAIHARSSRSKGGLVARNAATIPETLVDAELFGNEKNYPNPGMADRPGLIGEADGGTLFLDEFGELGSAAEAHLLRVLDEGEYQRLGEAKSRRSNFRLIAATNRSAAALKPDLAARLTLRIETPDLNERREDVPLLVVHLLRKMAAADKSIAARFFRDGNAEGEPRISLELMRALVTHRYSGNVRELHALLLEAIGRSEGDEPPPLSPASIPVDPTGSTVRPILHEIAKAESPGKEPSDPPVPPPNLTAEKVQASLDANNGALERTWRALGLPNRHALRRLIQKHRLEVRKRPKAS